MEALESRRLLASLLVTNGLDHGSGSLRAALDVANASPDDDTIAFDPGLNKVTLTSALTVTNTSGLETSGLTTIDGGPGIVTIERSTQPGVSPFRLFEVGVGAKASFQRLSLTGGMTSFDGGAIYNNGGKLSVSSVRLVGNHARDGGAIFSYGALNVDLSIFEDNTADEGGGAISATGTVTLGRSSLARNSAGYGGAIFNYGAISIIDSSTFSSNSARLTGGAIENDSRVTANDSRLTIVSSTLSGNGSSAGGGIFNQGTITVVSSTLSGNSATNAIPNLSSKNGGGICNNVGDVVLYNTIVANSLSGGDFAGAGTFSGDSNLVGNRPTGNQADLKGMTNTIFADPRLGPLQNNGGPTPTQLPFDGSAAINRGSVARAVDSQGKPLSPLPFDQRGPGYPRILGSSVDIGAVEYREAPGVVVTTDTDVLNPGDGLTSLREAVSYASELASASSAFSTVTFAPGITRVTVSLGPITLYDQVRIAGSTDRNVTITRSTRKDTMPFRLFTVPAGARSALERLNLTNGLVTSNIGGPGMIDGADSGGAVLNLGDLALTSCFVSDNSSSIGSGGAIASTGSLTLADTTLTRNSARYGGAIASTGKLVINGGSIASNTAIFEGAAIWNMGQATITGATFEQNEADSGGAILSYAGSVTIVDSKFRQNTARLRGGAICVDGFAWRGFGRGVPTLSIEGTTFDSNSVTYSGGAICAVNSPVTIGTASFLGNRADGNGGAIAISDSTLDAGTLTATKNTASSGGAIAANNTVITLRDGRFSKNSAGQITGQGGALYLQGSRLNLTTGTFSSNSANLGGGISTNSPLIATSLSMDSNSAGNGGGIFSYNGVLSIFAGSFSKNRATEGGGGAIDADGGSVTVLATFTSNSAATTSTTPASFLGAGGAISFSRGSSTSTFGRLDVSGSQFRTNTASRNGGAIFSSEPLVVRNASFVGNTAARVGGAIMATGLLTVDSTSFSSNTAAKAGALYTSAISASIVASQFLGNTSTTYGGALSNDGYLSIASSRFESNTTTLSGGAIDSSGALRVVECTFLTNQAGSSGGALSGSSLDVRSSTFERNSAGIGGAITPDGGGRLNLFASTFLNNTAATGAALFNPATTVITNSTFSGNSTATWLSTNFRPTGAGGAIANVYNGRLAVVCSTLAGNSASAGRGGGIYNAAATPVTLYDSIVARSPSGGDLVGLFTGSTNLVGDGSGTGLQGTIAGNPMLGPLASNGGPTRTYALLEGSPAIDAGDNSLALDPQGNPLVSDQRGAGSRRVFNGRVDLGAYEYFNPNLYVTTSLDVVNPNDPLTSLREAIAYADAKPGPDIITFDPSITTATLSTSSLVISSDITITGGVAGVTIVRDTTAGTPDFRLFRVDAGSTASFDHLSLQNGRDTQGGAVQNLGTLTINAASITGNSSSDSGGAIQNSGILKLIDTTLRANSSQLSGGALFNLGSLTLTRVDVRTNTAGVDGGGMWNDASASATVTGGSWEDNAAAHFGGAILSDGGLTAANVGFARNTAVAGGAILSSGTSTLTDLAFTQNLATQYNGGAFFNGGQASVTRGIFTGNQAGLHGGAVMNAGVVTIDDCDFTGNSTTYSGGAFSNRGTATVTNSRFTGNVSLISIGGAISTGAGATLDLRSSTFRDNRAKIHSGAVSVGGTATISDSTFTSNRVADWAGGAAFNEGNLTLIRDNFTDNSSPIAGAVHNGHDATLEINDSYFTANTAGAGAAIFNEGTIRLDGARFINNTATDYAGALDNRGPASITRSSFMGNQAPQAGAIGNQNTLGVADSTFQGNRATTWIGGAISSLAAGQLTVINSIFSNNSAHSGGAIYTAGTADVQGGSFSTNTAWGWGGGAIRSDWGSTLSVAGPNFTGNRGPNGGGIAASGSTTITGASFASNRAEGWSGAGVFNEGMLDLSDSIFTQGYAAGGGGALLNLVGAKATVRDTQMTGATAQGGGGVYNFGDVTLNRVTISSNYGSIYGAGIINEGMARLTDTTVSDNTVPSDAWTAGGIINDRSATLEITRGTLSGNSSPGGGAITNFGVATITDTTFSNNHALWVGGAIDNVGRASISGGQFTGNQAANRGGGAIHGEWGSTLDVSGSSFTRNSGPNGGALAVSGTTTVAGATFTSNRATVWAGGGIYNEGNLAVADSSFIEGSASWGGAIHNNDYATATIRDSRMIGATVDLGGGATNRGTLTLARVSITGNTARSSGGGIFNTRTLTVTDSTVANNTSGFEGGGILSETSDSSLTLVGSTIYGNSALSAGGVGTRGTFSATNSTFGANTALYVGGGLDIVGSGVLLNVTVAFNQAGYGGGIYSRPGASVNLSNSIVANTLNGGDLRGIFTGSRNLVRDGSGDGLVETLASDPLLGPLQENGGPTVTYALLAGSVAIDAGNDSLLPLSLITDQRGTSYSRKKGQSVDLGAFEF